MLCLGYEIVQQTFDQGESILTRHLGYCDTTQSSTLCIQADSWHRCLLRRLGPDQDPIIPERTASIPTETKDKVACCYWQQAIERHYSIMVLDRPSTIGWHLKLIESRMMCY